MSGIAGVLHKTASKEVGAELTRMLAAMRHRGQDSSGYALCGPPGDQLILRCAAEGQLEQVVHDVTARLTELDTVIESVHVDSTRTFRLVVQYDDDLKRLVDVAETVPHTRVLSVGHALEIFKDLGTAESVAERYDLTGFRGTHAIGHVRMATESTVDTTNAHPYWACPLPDMAVVHNGQLTNHHLWRRRLERRGYRFRSTCDSEIIAAYLADRITGGLSLEPAMKQSLDDLDGVFTYLVVTADSLGVAKDKMAAKPLVLGETDEVVVLASEEAAVRAVFGRETETRDPGERAVLVWRR
jgi:glutamate synthase domain-containing protein 1